MVKRKVGNADDAVPVTTSSFRYNLRSRDVEQRLPTPTKMTVVDEREFISAKRLCEEYEHSLIVKHFDMEKCATKSHARSERFTFSEYYQVLQAGSLMVMNSKLCEKGFKFDTSVLDAKIPVLEHLRGRVDFSLVSVVISLQGHYTALVKQQGSWWYIDDEHVENIGENFSRLDKITENAIRLLFVCVDLTKVHLRSEVPRGIPNLKSKPEGKMNLCFISSLIQALYIVCNPISDEEMLRVVGVTTQESCSISKDFVACILRKSQPFGSLRDVSLCVQKLHTFVPHLDLSGYGDAQDLLSLLEQGGVLAAFGFDAWSQTVLITNTCNECETGETRAIPSRFYLYVNMRPDNNEV